MNFIFCWIILFEKTQYGGGGKEINLGEINDIICAI